MSCLHIFYKNDNEYEYEMDSFSYSYSLSMLTLSIEQELRGSGIRIGYRQMTQRLLHAHGITTDKETVREMLKILNAKM